MANNTVSFFLKLTVMSMLIISCSQNLPTLQDQKSTYSFTTEDELQEENTLKP